jgi:hypothetical protein
LGHLTIPRAVCTQRVYGEDEQTAPKITNHTSCSEVNWTLYHFWQPFVNSSEAELDTISLGVHMYATTRHKRLWQYNKLTLLQAYADQVFTNWRQTVQISTVHNLSKTSGMHIKVIYQYIHITSIYNVFFIFIFVTAYPCFTFEKYASISTFPFRALVYLYIWWSYMAE